MRETSESEAAAPVRVQPVVRGAVALSIRQPWAWLIIHAAKDIENRTWPTQVRGNVLIHASKGMTRDEYAEAFDVLDEIETTGQLAIPSFDELKRQCGGIVGHMHIVDCVTEHPSPWFFGPYGFVLDAAGTLPFYPCEGSLGFFMVSTPNTKLSDGK